MNATSSSYLPLARAVIEREARAITGAAAQLDGRFDEAVQLLLGCTGHVLVAGVGTSNAVALRLAHLLSCCGTPALFLHPADSLHGGAGAVTERDVVVAISKGGESGEVNGLARIARQHGARVLAITARPESTLGSMASVVLEVTAPEDVDPHGMIATGSSLVNAAVGDALCIALLEARGYGRAAFEATHPGGAVGIRIATTKERS